MSDRLPADAGMRSVATGSIRARVMLMFLVTNVLVVGIASLVLVAFWRTEVPTSGGPSAGTLSFALLVAFGTAAVGGLLAGLLMTRALARPLESLSGYMQREGQAALEGLDVERHPRDLPLPAEIHSVLEVFDQLLEDTVARRDELLEARSFAEASALNLSLAVNDSTEAKLLVRGDTIVMANPAAESLAGLATGSLSGGPSSVLSGITITTEAGLPLEWEALVDAALKRPVRTCIERPDGSKRWAELLAVEHDEPAPTLLITARDITEQRRVEELRAEVMTFVSHDLRAPLTVISGYLELLERPLDEQQRQAAVAAALASADRMNGLIDDILVTTRAEELFAPVSLARVEMGTIADEVASSLDLTSGHQMRSRALSPGFVLGESRRLRQALVNLVSNAIKYTPETGSIVVSVERVDDRVHVSVQDNGPGIPPEDREAVFERFTRLGSGDDRPGGFGLGLYIAKAIVESHGGSLSVEDPSEGDGARFLISLPSAPGL